MRYFNMYAELNACMRKRLGACMTVLCLPGWRFIPTVAGTRLLQCKSVHIIWFASQARHLYSSCLTWPCISKQGAKNGLPYKEPTNAKHDSTGEVGICQHLIHRNAN